MNQKRKTDSLKRTVKDFSPTPDSKFREFLSLPVSDLDERIDGILELKKRVQDNAKDLAVSITERTGKAIKWSRAEVRASIRILTEFERVPDLLQEAGQVPGYAQLTVPTVSRGISAIFPDSRLPLFSLFSKLLPSVLSRKNTVVFPDLTSFKIVSSIFDLPDSKSLNNSTLLAFREHREDTSPSLHTPVPVDVLIAGNFNLKRFSEKHLISLLSAEYGNGYSVHLSPGSDLDTCAEEAAKRLVSLHLPHYFRPGEITMFTDDEEYFVNRLSAELEKLNVGDAFDDNTDVGVPSDPGQSDSVARLIMDGRGKKFDIPLWKGPLGGTFAPCLISGIFGTLDTEIITADLPILRTHTVASIEEAIGAWDVSGNSIVSAVWSRDENILPYVIKRSGASVVFLNSLVRDIPGAYSNPSAGNATTGGAMALYRMMASRKTGFLSL